MYLFKVKKRITALFFAMLILLMSACSSAPATSGDDVVETPADDNAESSEEVSAFAANVNEPGVFPICIEPITLTIATPQSAFVEDYDTNEYTKWIEEQSNINLEFELMPTADAAQKLEIMIQSGSALPDILLGFNSSDEAILNYGSQGAIIPLDSYYDEWAYHINDAFDDLLNQDMREWLRSADGNTYYVAKSNEQIANMYSLRSWINTTWLDNLGLDMPTTTDEFEAVLTAFVNDDPNQNGVNDEIGMIGNSTGWRALSADFLMNAFIYDDTVNRFIVEDGILTPAYTQDAWKDGLSYINSLVEQGLFSEQSFTMDDAQTKQLLEGSGVAQVGVFTHGNPGAVLTPTNDVLYSEYEPLPPLTGPDGANNVAFFPDIPQKNFMITADCENPEAAFRLADLMCSEEGYMRTRFGVPEVDWREPTEDDYVLYEPVEAKVVTILPWGTVNNQHWAFTTPGMVPYGVVDAVAYPNDGSVAVDNGTVLIYESVEYYVDKEPEERADIIKFTLDEAEQIVDMKTTINAYVKESMALFAVGEMDIESDWDSYLSELDAMGLEEYVGISQTSFERN